jgi:hypothetical protein
MYLLLYHLNMEKNIVGKFFVNFLFLPHRLLACNSTHPVESICLLTFEKSIVVTKIVFLVFWSHRLGHTATVHLCSTNAIISQIIDCNIYIAIVAVGNVIVTRKCRSGNCLMCLCLCASDFIKSEMEFRVVHINKHVVNNLKYRLKMVCS